MATSSGTNVKLPSRTGISDAVTAQCQNAFVNDNDRDFAVGYGRASIVFDLDLDICRPAGFKIFCLRFSRD